MQIHTHTHTHLAVFQVLHVGGVVSVSLTATQHMEAAAPNCVHEGAAVPQHVQLQDIQHAAVVCKPATAATEMTSEMTSETTSEESFQLGPELSLGVEGNLYGCTTSTNTNDLSQMGARK